MKGFGLKELKAHVPDLRSTGRCALAALIAAASFTAAYLLMAGVDALFPDWALPGQAAVVGLGFACIAPFFLKRAGYQKRWGKQAYRNAFALHVLTGLPMIFAAVAHTAFLPGERIITGWLVIAAEVAAWYLAVTGSLLDVRAILAFGFDNLGMLYVYHPDEGRLMDSAIYAILRHPVYSALIRIGMALALWRGNLASLGFWLLMPFGMLLWLRLVEENELVRRFGQSYAKYRSQVPAFFPRPGALGRFYRFLLAGK